MHAAVCTRYGTPEAITVETLPRPQPRRGEVTVRVCAAPVTAADRRIRALDLPPGYGAIGRLVFGFARPRRVVLGGCFAGEIEAVGEGVRGWQPGDAVAGMTGLALGTHAEVCRVCAAALVRRPPDIDCDMAAAALFGGSAAFDYLARAAPWPAATRMRAPARVAAARCAPVWGRGAGRCADPGLPRKIRRPARRYTRR